MADIKSLEASRDKAADKVEKCKATIVRHEGQKAKKLAALVKQGVDVSDLQAAKDAARAANNNELMWAIFEAERKDDDIKGATRKLRDAEGILANWQSRLDIEVEKERFLSEQAPAVIIEFLQQWVELARDWHIQAYARFLELKHELAEARHAAEKRFLAENPGARTWGREYDKFMKADEDVTRLAGQMSMLGGNVARMATYRKEEERLAWLDKMLEEDRKAKMFYLIHQVNEIVGTITDASYLRVNGKGNLDGFVIGEKGKAHVSTIGVGGYNIVCFHYRTNVYAIKE